MRERFERRIDEGLERIARACQQRRHHAGVIERRVGRLLGQNARAARLFSVRVKPDASGRVGLTWSRKTAAVESARRCEGCYLLRSNVSDWTAEELWKAYMQLTEAEISQEDCTSSATCRCGECTGYDSGSRVPGVGPMDGATRRPSIRRIRMVNQSRSTVPPRADGRRRQCRRRWGA
jgi:hypothetical protein